MQKQRYEKPEIQTVSSREILESLGPASASYGNPMTGMGD